MRVIRYKNTNAGWMDSADGLGWAMVEQKASFRCYTMSPIQYPTILLTTISSAHSKLGRWLTASDTSTSHTHPTHIPHPASTSPLLPSSSALLSLVSCLFVPSQSTIAHPVCPVLCGIPYRVSLHQGKNLPQKLLFWPTVFPSFDGFKLSFAFPFCHPSSFLNPFLFSLFTLLHSPYILLHTHPIIH